MSNEQMIEFPPVMEAAYVKQNEKTPISRVAWGLAQLAMKLTGEDQREAKEALYNHGYLVVRLDGKLCLIPSARVPVNPYTK